jgi:hypothetical protein
MDGFHHRPLYAITLFTRRRFPHWARDDVPHFALAGFDNVPHDVVTAVAHHGFMHWPLHTVTLLAHRRFVHGAQHFETPLAQLGFPDGHLPRYFPRFVDRLAFLAITGNLSLVVNSLADEPVTAGLTALRRRFARSAADKQQGNEAQVPAKLIFHDPRDLAKDK